tara:strand:+ start:10 stop:180 length:171 start_codon:yes stop_codon:yes gene_type:complete
MAKIDYTKLQEVESKIDKYYDINEDESIKLYKMLDTLKEFMETNMNDLEIEDNNNV